LATLLQTNGITLTAALQRSTLRRNANRGEHESVPSELMKWMWATGKRLPEILLLRRLDGQRYSGGFISL
jgi:lysozyme